MVDGIGMSVRYAGVMLTNSVAVKQDSPYYEWYYRWLEPNVHYVPFKYSMSDLVDKVKWLQEDEQRAKAIAYNGSQFMQEIYRTEEVSALERAIGSLFDGCTVVITPLEHTSDLAQQACADFWQALGANTMTLGFADHDAALAVTSHLPHLLAFAFMEQVEESHLALTGGGFRDFTRIAAANPELWWRIMRLNRGALAQALEQYSQNLKSLAAAIDTDDEAQGLALIRAAAAKRQAADKAEN